MTRRGFTLIELLVSMTVFVLAISVALFATVGSNSMLAKADSRAAIVEGSRTVTDTLKRMVEDTNYNQISLVSLTVDSVDYDIGVLSRLYNQELSQNICQVIGRAAEVTDATSGVVTYAPSNTGGYIATWIFKLNDSGVCETTNMQTFMLFQNRLTNSNVQVTDFQISINDIYSDPVLTDGNSSLAMLRYRLKLQVTEKASGGTDESKRASIEVASGLAIGLN